MKDEEWNRVINLNLTSSFFLSKYTIKKMLKNKDGKIINIPKVLQPITGFDIIKL